MSSVSVTILDPIYINLEGEPNFVINYGYEDIILLDGGQNYQLSSDYLDGKSFIIIINNPNPIPTVITQSGPNNPLHVWAPNAPKFTFIKVLYVLNQWIKI